jgi:hypothetical protein
MRLKPEKIEQLSELIYDTLAKNPDLKLRGERKDITFEIRRVITEDFQAEEAIEAEARKLLEKHEDEMRRTNVNFDQALRKTKQKLARDRGMVL